VRVWQLVLALLVSLCLPAVVLSPAQAATEVDLSVSVAVTANSVTVTGMVRAEGNPVGSMSVAIYLNDSFVTVASTEGDGSFSHPLGALEPGNYAVRATTAGDNLYEVARATAEFTVDKPSKAETTLTLTRDPPRPSRAPGSRSAASWPLPAPGWAVAWSCWRPVLAISWARSRPGTRASSPPC
jgi:hypothetical protein